MKKNKNIIIGVCIAVGILIVLGVSGVLVNRILKTSTFIMKDSGEDMLPQEPFVGVVSVKGVIQQQTATGPFELKKGYQHKDALNYIDRMIDSDANRGILLNVDSPGGTVYESDELYLKILEYKEKTNRPVWTYMGHSATSGGYYVSAPSDKIYANPNTVTGSIGVIISGYDMSGLYEKLGIRPFSVTSGPNKDMSQLTEEQIGIYQASVDESYERFVQIVADGRGMTEEEVKALADGRIYTAKQAIENGLVDCISQYDEMKSDMQKEVGNVLFYTPKQKNSKLALLLNQIGEVKPKSEAEVLTGLMEQFGSGVPMYYTE